MQRKGENAVKEGVTGPFTFRESLGCSEPHPFVQVLLNRSAVCAQVKSGWVANDGAFLWSVSLLGPFYGSGSFPERMVRQCSGVDGTCICADEQARKEGTHASGEEPSRAGASATPGEVTCM